MPTMKLNWTQPFQWCDDVITLYLLYIVVVVKRTQCVESLWCDVWSERNPTGILHELLPTTGLLTLKQTHSKTQEKAFNHTTHGKQSGFGFLQKKNECMWQALLFIQWNPLRSGSHLQWCPEDSNTTITNLHQITESTLQFQTPQVQLFTFNPNRCNSH